MKEDRANSEAMLACLRLSDLHLEVSRVTVLRALFDASDEELQAAWRGFHEEHWPEDRFRLTRPGDPGFRFNHLLSTRGRP